MPLRMQIYVYCILDYAPAQMRANAGALPSNASSSVFRSDDILAC